MALPDWVADPLNPLTPPDNVPGGLAAREIRALKDRVNDLDDEMMYVLSVLGAQIAHVNAQTAAAFKQLTHPLALNRFAAVGTITDLPVRYTIGGESTGWVPLDGSIPSLLAADYPKLAFVISTTMRYATTLPEQQARPGGFGIIGGRLYLPDLRGVVKRGLDTRTPAQGGLDVQGAVGTTPSVYIARVEGDYQKDEYLRHSHTASFTQAIVDDGDGSDHQYLNTGSGTNVTTSQAGNGRETTGKNISVVWSLRVSNEDVDYDAVLPLEPAP